MHVNICKKVGSLGLVPFKMKKHVYSALLFVAIGISTFGCKSSKIRISTDEENSNQNQETLIGSDSSQRNNPNKEAHFQSESEQNTQTIRHSYLGRDVERFLVNSPVFSGHFTGFSLYDISANEFIVNHNAEKYFTPASNVKVKSL